MMAISEKPQEHQGLIPRKVLFGNPDRTQVGLSPDGRFISYLAPFGGVMNIHVAPIEDPQAAKPITHNTRRGVPFYGWAFDSRHVLFGRDTDGDENWNIYCADLARPGDARNLTPFPNAQANIAFLSHRHRDAVLIALNQRDTRFHDVYVVDIAIGDRRLLFHNPGQIGENMVEGFRFDHDFRLRLVSAVRPDGSIEWYRPRMAVTPMSPCMAWHDAEWETFDVISYEDSVNTFPHGFDATGNLIYFEDSRGRDTSALYLLDTRTNLKTLLAEDPRCDLGVVLMHPTEHHAQIAEFYYDKATYKVLDPSIEADFAYLRTISAGNIHIDSRTEDDRLWIVAYQPDDSPVLYYMFDRRAAKATFLFSHREDLAHYGLANMYPVIIPSRDGLSLVSYLSLPNGSYPSSNGARFRRPLATVLVVHGGPHDRDYWGLDNEHQWLANRGYAVLSVNYRGSSGFGKSFFNAGDREWGGRMHDDLIDAVNWAIANGIADAGRVAIIGGSYGGYASLVGLTFTPDVFACAVDLVGPSRLATLLESIPPYWAAGINRDKKQIGDYTTEEGRAFLDSRSPLTFADRISKPLLIAQGANDPRVKQSESDQMVDAMRRNGLPVIYLLYPDEGHGFNRPENWMSFRAAAEQFLAAHLGGRAEPIGDDFKGSSIEIVEGAQHIPGVSEALRP